jgi:hypothetical protein
MHYWENWKIFELGHGLVSIGVQSVGNDCSLLPYILTLFKIWEFEPSVPFLEPKIAVRHKMRLVSKLGTVHPYGIN